MTPPLQSPRSITSLVLLLFCAFAPPKTHAAPPKPNVIYILSDDVGWGDLSLHGGGVPTPNIDRLFSRGVELTQFMGSGPGIADGSTTPLWTNGKDTRPGKFTATELFKDLQIRTVDVADVGKGPGSCGRSTARWRASRMWQGWTGSIPRWALIGSRGPNPVPLGRLSARRLSRAGSRRREREARGIGFHRVRPLRGGARGWTP